MTVDEKESSNHCLQIHSVRLTKPVNYMSHGIHSTHTEGIFHISLACCKVRRLGEALLITNSHLPLPSSDYYKLCCRPPCGPSTPHKHDTPPPPSPPWGVLRLCQGAAFSCSATLINAVLQDQQCSWWSWSSDNSKRYSGELGPCC